MGSPIPKELMDNSNVWFHGSIQAAKRAQVVTKWQVHANWELLKCSYYYKIFPNEILQKEHKFIKLSELIPNKEILYQSSLANDASLFFRPDGNDKDFTGGCISLDSFEKLYDLMTFYNPSLDTPIVVAKPQNILAEARFLVVSNKLITGSYYRIGKDLLKIQVDVNSDLFKKAESYNLLFAKYLLEYLNWVLSLRLHILEIKDNNT